LMGAVLAALQRQADEVDALRLIRSEQFLEQICMVTILRMLAHQRSQQSRRGLEALQRVNRVLRTFCQQAVKHPTDSFDAFRCVNQSDGAIFRFSSCTGRSDPL
ncbi:MAG: hypothetical protein ACK55I_21875, partial [bacterium]